MIHLTDPKEIIAELRKAMIERNLKPIEVVELLEDAQTPVSLSTVRRIYSGEHDETDYSFKNIIMPMANLLFDIDKRSDDEPTEVSAMKELLLAKKAKIFQLEKENAALNKKITDLSEKNREKIKKITAEHDADIKKWMHQIEKKDERIDSLLEMVKKLMDKCENCEFHHK